MKLLLLNLTLSKSFTTRQSSSKLDSALAAQSFLFHRRSLIEKADSPSVGRSIRSLYMVVTLEQIRMCASSCEQEYQLCVVLFPNQEPVGFEVALPATAVLSRQLVWTIAHRELAIGLQQTDGGLEQFHIIAARSVSLRNVLVILTSYIAGQIPNDLNVSSDEEKLSTRPARLSSCERT